MIGKELIGTAYVVDEQICPDDDLKDFVIVGLLDNDRFDIWCPETDDRGWMLIGGFSDALAAGHFRLRGRLTDLVGCPTCGARVQLIHHGTNGVVDACLACTACEWFEEL